MRKKHLMNQNGRVVTINRLKTKPLSGINSYYVSVLDGYKREFKHRAFAAGFFGFHYIRAMLDDDISLKKESLELLRQVSKLLRVNNDMFDTMALSQRHSYKDLKDTFINTLWMRLEDTFSPDIKWMIVFGYQTAAVLAWLIGTMECRTKASELSETLKTLESGGSVLLGLARKADVSERIINMLLKFKDIIGCSKTKVTAHKCRQLIASIVSELLIQKTPMEVLN